MARDGRPLLILLAAGLALAACQPAGSSGTAAAAPAAPGRLPKAASPLALVDQFVANPPRDRARVEDFTGADLTETSNRYWALYSARDVPLGNTRLAVDYRVAGPEATGEETAFLVLSFTGPCTPKAEVFARYPGLKLQYPASSHSLDATNGFARAEPWGELSMGFTQRAPDCLADAVFRVQR